MTKEQSDSFSDQGKSILTLWVWLAALKSGRYMQSQDARIRAVVSGRQL